MCAVPFVSTNEAVALLLTLQGYNGSQLWDTAFTVQAIMSTNLSEEFGLTLKKAHEFIKNSQVSIFYQNFVCMLY